MISERIKTVRKSLKMNQAEFAAYLGVTRSTISEFENGTRDPSKAFLLSLSEKEFSIDWLLTGKGNMIKLNIEPFGGEKSPAKKDDEIDKKNLQEIESGFTIDSAPVKRGAPGSTDREAREEQMTNVMERTPMDTQVIMHFSDLVRQEIPVVVAGESEGRLIPVIDQGLSAGIGFGYDKGETIRYVQIPAWMARRSRDLAALPIYGDSMDPTICNGDLAVCDAGGFAGDGVYMLRDESRGLMFCKRVLWTPDGWTIKSDNPIYEPIQVSNNTIQIIARVIGAVKEVK